MEEIRYIELERLHPHPDNPRKTLGELSELADSIKAKGIYQNLTVIPLESVEPEKAAELGDGHYTVIIGHRRSAAAKLAGLETVPCIIREMDRKEQLQTMLLENMQRSDLTVYEQAQGFQMMLDLGSTVEEISEKSGFSQTTVRRRVKMMELDQKLLKEVSGRQLNLSDFDKLAQIKDIKARNEALEKIGTDSFDQLVKTKVRRERAAELLPELKKLLKIVKAKAIKQSETWGSKYINEGTYVYIADWDGGAEIIPKVKGQLYYFLEENYGTVRFYREREKPAPVKKSAEEKERERRLSEVWAKADELAVVHNSLRREFVEGLTVTSANAMKFLEAAIAAHLCRTIDYISTDRELMAGILGLDDRSYDPKRGEKALDSFRKLPQKEWPMLMYSAFGDGTKLAYTTGYKGRWPEYKRPSNLDALYAWLCSLGYEMSEDEKALQSGTHEIFEEGE